MQVSRTGHYTSIVTGAQVMTSCRLSSPLFASPCTCPSLYGDKWTNGQMDCGTSCQLLCLGSWPDCARLASGILQPRALVFPSQGLARSSDWRPRVRILNLLGKLRHRHKKKKI